MKQFFTAIIFSACLISFAYAETPSNNWCSLSSQKGTKFRSTDEKTHAVLFYYFKKGDGVSGEISNENDDIIQSASLVNSSCRENVVQLQWAEPEFNGTIKGTLNAETLNIENVSGTINGEEFHDDLLFDGYQ